MLPPHTPTTTNLKSRLQCRSPKTKPQEGNDTKAPSSSDHEIMDFPWRTKLAGSVRKWAATEQRRLQEGPRRPQPPPSPATAQGRGRVFTPAAHHLNTHHTHWRQQTHQPLPPSQNRRRRGAEAAPSCADRHPRPASPDRPAKPNGQSATTCRRTGRQHCHRRPQPAPTEDAASPTWLGGPRSGPPSPSGARPHQADVEDGAAATDAAHSPRPRRSNVAKLRPSPPARLPQPRPPPPPTCRSTTIKRASPRPP